MEGNLGIQQRQGVRDVAAGSEGRWWVRWSLSNHCRRRRSVPPRRGRGMRWRLLSGSRCAQQCLFITCHFIKKKKTLTLLEILKTQNRLLVESSAFLAVKKLFPQVGFVRNKFRSHTVRRKLKPPVATRNHQVSALRVPRTLSPCVGEERRAGLGQDLSAGSPIVGSRVGSGVPSGMGGPRASPYR